MPRVPIKTTKFPGQKFMSRDGSSVRFNLKYPEDESIYNSLVRAGYAPVKGPDLPLEVYAARKAMLESRKPWFYAEEAYKKAMEDERARQAYNRRARAWNDYQDQWAYKRKFYPNVGKIREDISLRYPDMSRDEIMEATRNPEALDTWYNGQRYREDKIQGMYGGYNFDYSPYPEVESFEEFPDELVSMPWRDDFGEHWGY